MVVATSTPAVPSSTAAAPRFPPSQRQWQRERTMAAIERAALQVFVREGYGATTAEHLADAAGVSVRTLFRYFPSGKSDVLLAELRRTLDDFEASVRARPAEEPLTVALDRAQTEWQTRTFAINIGEARQITGQIAREHPDLLARLLGERHMLAERLVDFFGARLGLDPDQDLRPRLYAHCYISASITGYLTSLALPDQDPNTLVAEALALISPLLSSTP